MREEQHIPNRRRIGQQHDQPIDADPLPRRRRHAVLQRADVVGVEVHGLLVAGFLLVDLLGEALGLILGIVQLREAVGNLAAADEEFEALGDERVVVLAAGQR